MAQNLLLQAGVALTVLAAAGALAFRYGQSVIPAYILAGVLVGPHGPTIGDWSLAVVEHREFVDFLAELGVVLLLFFLGLEFSLETLLSNRRRIVAASSVDLLVNLPLGFLVGFAFGFSALESLFLAGIAYISSSAVITKTLIDLGWIADPESEAILGVLVFEDVAVAVYLAVLGALVLGGGPTSGVAVSLAVTFGFLLALAAVAGYGAPVVERAFATRSDELFAVGVVGATVLVAGVALALGVSEAVAAFFVGTAFGATDHAGRVERLIAPARDLFAAVFFFAIGLSTDPAVVAGVLGPLALLVAVSVPGKLASGFVGGRLYGLSSRRSIRVGTGLVARGEFSLVVAALAASAGGSRTLTEVVPAIAVGYVLVTSFLGPLLMRHAAGIARLTGAAAAD